MLAPMVALRAPRSRTAPARPTRPGGCWAPGSPGQRRAAGPRGGRDTDPRPARPRVRPAAPGARSLLAGLCLLLALAPRVAAHDNSSSRTLLVAVGPTIDHFVRLQAESVWEVLPLDPDGNRFVEPHELEAVREPLLAYLRRHYQLVADDGPTLEGELIGLTLSQDPTDALSMQQFVELHLRYACPEVPRTLHVTMDLFRDTSPTHLDLLAVSWNDAGEAPAPPQDSVRLWAGEPRHSSWSGRLRPWRADLAAGARAVLAAPLALACLLALLLGAARGGRPGLTRATALACGGGLGLALALGERLPDPGGAGLAAGLAVVYAAALDLRPGAGSRPLVLEALILGGLQGLALLRAAPPPADGRALGLALGAGATLALLGLVLGPLVPSGRVGRALAVAALLVGVHGTWRAWAG